MVTVNMLLADNTYKRIHLFLILPWVFSIFGGVYYASTISLSVIPVMRSIPVGSVSIVSLIVVRFLPFLISACFFLLKIFRLQLFVCAYEGFLIGFSIYSAIAAFDSAGWLIYILLITSGLLFNVFQFYYQCLSAHSCPFSEASYLASGTVLIITLSFVEYFVVIPFLQIGTK